MESIPITKIHPSPNPIRKTWDEDKMGELAQSIAERGVIVPIKVRPNHDGYEIVYGHRRVEASRRAGLVEMPAIVEGVDDTEALIQALIENVQREDMTPVDQATAIDALRDHTGWSDREISRRGILSTMQLFRLKNISGLPDDIKSYVGRGPEAAISTRHVEYAKRAGDNHGYHSVLRKAEKEELGISDTRAVADAYKAADTPELKEAVLNTSGKLGDSERILDVARMKVAGRRVAEGHEEQRRKAFEEFDSAVKDFLDSMRMFDRMIGAATKAAEYGKFSPEAKPFTVRKIDQLIEKLEGLREVLNNG